MLTNCRQNSKRFPPSESDRPPRTVACLRRLAVALALALAAGGCGPRQAPLEVVTARTLEEALQRAGEVEFAQLSAEALEAFPAELAALPRLRKLSLRGQTALAPLPEALGDFANLRWLDLSGMGLNDLPSSLGRLPVEQLYLSDNRFAVLPDVVGALGGLTYLNLDRNSLGALPPSVGGLGALRWVRLNNNQLADLPDELAAWTAVRRIYLRENRLREVPRVLFQLDTLEQLDLGANPISELPEAIGRLRRLERLDLNHTAIQTLPDAIVELRSLRHLVLTGSPIAVSERPRWRAALPGCHIEF